MQVWEPLIVLWFHTFLGRCIVGVTLFHDVPCVRIGTVCCEQKKSTCNFAVARCRRMQAELRKKRKSGEALVVQQDMEVSVHLPVFAHLSICVSALWGASKQQMGHWGQLESVTWWHAIIRTRLGTNILSDAVFLHEDFFAKTPCFPSRWYCGEVTQRNTEAVPAVSEFDWRACTKHKVPCWGLWFLCTWTAASASRSTFHQKHFRPQDGRCEGSKNEWPSYTYHGHPWSGFAGHHFTIVHGFVAVQEVEKGSRIPSMLWHALPSFQCNFFALNTWAHFMNLDETGKVLPSFDCLTQLHCFTNDEDCPNAECSMSEDDTRRSIMCLICTYDYIGLLKLYVVITS